MKVFVEGMHNMEANAKQYADLLCQQITQKNVSVQYTSLYLEDDYNMEAIFEVEIYTSWQETMELGYKSVIYESNVCVSSYTTDWILSMC